MDLPGQFYHMRSNSITGFIELEQSQKNTIHFAEWWNGEGVDLEINHKSIALSMEEMHLVVSVAVALGMVDRDGVRDTVRKLKLSAGG